MTESEQENDMGVRFLPLAHFFGMIRLVHV